VGSNTCGADAPRPLKWALCAPKPGLLFRTILKGAGIDFEATLRAT